MTAGPGCARKTLAKDSQLDTGTIGRCLKRGNGTRGSCAQLLQQDGRAHRHFAGRKQQIEIKAPPGEGDQNRVPPVVLLCSSGFTKEKYQALLFFTLIFFFFFFPLRVPKRKTTAPNREF
jgi:hypothetical protein